MESLLTTGNITFVLGIVGILFTVYNYFREPQVKSDKTDALLAQQLQWSEQGTDRRFKDMQDRFDLLVAANQNHLHTVDTKVDALRNDFGKMEQSITRLSTIIEERIPKKT